MFFTPFGTLAISDLSFAVSSRDELLVILASDVRILLFCARRIGYRAQLRKRRRYCKILQMLFCNIVRSSAMTVATASAKHFGLKVIK